MILHGDEAHFLIGLAQSRYKDAFFCASPEKSDRSTTGIAIANIFYNKICN